MRRQSNGGAVLKWREKLGGLRTGFLKSPEMAGVAMPQLYGREIATGELAQVTGDTGVTQFLQSLHMR
jgi:hypothetical protein